MSEGGRLCGTADEGGWWPAFDSNEDALAMLTAAIERAGYHPAEDVAIAVDVAASEFVGDSGYVLGLERRQLGGAEWREQLANWIGRFPVVSIEDPLGQDDDEGWRAFGARFGGELQIVGDDYLVTSAARVRSAAAEHTCNAVLVKVNQRGTISEAFGALQAARESGLAAIVSARSGESEDTTLAHLAVGWNAGQVKVGSFARGERTAKWNELLRIEEALGAAAAFAGRGVLGRRCGP
jgi:enolase